MNEPLTDEEYQQLVELGGQNELLTAQQKRQLALADQLRGSTTPQMRSANGQIFAPGKAEAIVGVLGGIGGGLMQGQAGKSGDQIAANSQKQRAMLLRGITGSGRPQQGLTDMGGLSSQEAASRQGIMDAVRRKQEATQGMPVWQQAYPEF